MAFGNPASSYFMGSTLSRVYADTFAAGQGLSWAGQTGFRAHGDSIGGAGAAQGILAGTELPAPSRTVSNMNNMTNLTHSMQYSIGGAVAQHLKAPSRSLSTIAQQLLLHPQPSAAPSRSSSNMGAVLGALKSSGGAVHSTLAAPPGRPPVLRALPPPLGPYPLPHFPSISSPAVAVAEDPHTSPQLLPSNPSKDVDSGNQAASAGFNDVGHAHTLNPDDSHGQHQHPVGHLERVLQLRCMLVYHLQASLIYDAQVMIINTCCSCQPVRPPTCFTSAHTLSAGIILPVEE